MFFMKYLTETIANGKKAYCVRIPKQPRKFFKAKGTAVAYLQNYNKASKVNLDDFALLTSYQLEDIRKALSMLPKDKTLTETVKLAYGSINTKPLKLAISEFVELKDKSPITLNEKIRIKNRLNELSTYDFEQINGTFLLNLVNSWGFKPKTKKDYLALYRSFFGWAKVRKYTNLDPFASVHSVDLPQVPKKNIEFASVDSIAKFFDLCQQKYPRLVAGFALIAFAGLRRSEAFKVAPNDVDFDKKTIRVRAKISKTGDNWLQINLPANVWKWLEKYPIPTKSYNTSFAFSKLNKTLKLPHNALRHSFATYHLSLYRDPPRTSLLLKHRNPAMLWQHYLGGLVPEAQAQKYFEIAP